MEKPKCYGDYTFGQIAAERSCHECLFQKSCINATAEEDPYGKNPHEPGAKLDANKPIAGELIFGFPHAMSLFVEVATYGAKKYSRYGFFEVQNAETRYIDAAMRHLLKYGMGEQYDPESGLPHLAHACWCLAAVLEIKERNPQ